MGPVGYQIRSFLRHRRSASVSLALLVAVALVVPLTAAAGARRTASALDRMRAELEPGEVDVQFESAAPPADALERIAALPDVAAVGEGASFLMGIEGSDLEFFSSFGQGSLRGGIGVGFERARMVAGRVPDAADEVMVSAAVASDLGIDLGDRIRIETLTPAGLESYFAGEPTGYDGPVLDMEVVGVGRQPEEITGGSDVFAPNVVVAPPFFSAWDGEIAFWDGIFLVDLHDGFAAVERFEEAVRAEFAERDDIGVNVSAERERIVDSLNAQTLATWLLAAAAGVAAAVVIVQAVARHVRDDRTEAVVAGIGGTRRQRSLTRAGVAVVPVVIGAVVATVGAAAASTWFPGGAVRRVDPDTGARIDLVVLLVGAVGVVLLALVAAVSSRTRPVSIRPTASSVERVTRAIGSIAVATGVRRALTPDHTDDVAASRGALVATAAAVLGITAASVFGANLDRLVGSPSAYGFNWDLGVGLGDDLDDEAAIGSASSVVDDARIAGASVVRIDNVVLEGREAFVFAIEPLVGDVGFTVVEGRAAQGIGEVTLGKTTMRDLDVSIGDVIHAAGIDGEDVPLTVVGQSLFPTVENEDPARGAGMRLDTYLGLSSPGVGFPELYVEVAEHATADEVSSMLGEIGFVNGAVAPPAIENLREIDAVPWLLALFLAVLGTVAAAHALLSSVRRRRLELAVLASLGLRRRQLVGSVLAQAATFGIVGLVIGVPVGVAVGRQSWRAVADGLGFSTDVAVPLAVAGLVPAVLLVVVAAGGWPANAAAKTPAAVLARSE